MRSAKEEARGDDDDDVDDSSERSSWYAGCGWRLVLDAIECCKVEGRGGADRKSSMV